MSRASTLPTTYATIGELERGFLHQIRRFGRACGELETAAGIMKPIMLSAPGMSTPRAPVEQPGELDPQHGQLELLRSQVILLQNMSAQILVNFPGDGRADALRKRVDDLCRVIETKSDTLRETLGRSARKTVDRVVVGRNHSLMTSLQADMKKNVGHVNEMYLVGNAALPGLRGEMTQVDVAYIHLTDLRGPDGFVHPHYYVVTAHPQANPTGRLLPMYVSAGPDYRLPSRVKWLSSAKSPTELKKVVMDLLVSEGVIGKTFQRDLPVPGDIIRFVHDNVKKTTVQGDQIRVLVRDRAGIEETRAAIRRQLAGIVRQVDPRNRDVIRDRVDPTRGIITLTFSLPGALRGRVVDSGVIDKIGRLLDMDPATVRRVRTAIENPE